MSGISSSTSFMSVLALRRPYCDDVHDVKVPMVVVSAICLRMIL